MNKALRSLLEHLLFNLNDAFVNAMLRGKRRRLTALAMRLARYWVLAFIDAVSVLLFHFNDNFHPAVFASAFRRAVVKKRSFFAIAAV